MDESYRSKLIGLIERLLFESVYSETTGERFLVREILHRVNEAQFTKVKKDLNGKLITLLNNIKDNVSEYLPVDDDGMVHFMINDGCCQALLHFEEGSYQAAYIETMLVFSRYSYVEGLTLTLEPKQALSKSEAARRNANARWALQREAVADIKVVMRKCWGESQHAEAAHNDMARVIESKAGKGDLSLDKIHHKALLDAAHEVALELGKQVRGARTPKDT